MSTLHIRGINWEIVSDGGSPTKPAYTHKNIRIAWEPVSGTWQAKNEDGVSIIARELPSCCIKDMTTNILDAYAARIVPSWKLMWMWRFPLKKKSRKRKKKTVETLSPMTSTREPILVEGHRLNEETGEQEKVSYYLKFDS